MAYDAHKNFAYSTVATAPAPATSGTSLVVFAGDGTKFPAASFNATVWPANTQPTTSNAEIVRVTVIATDTFTITRAQEGSAARTIVVGDQIAATITAKTATDIESYAPQGGTTNQVLRGVTGTVPAYGSLVIADLPAAICATNQTTFANKDNASNGSVTMLGIGGAITPTKTGTILITVSGWVTSGSTAFTNTFRIYTGTGSAPTNGAAVTGTARGVASDSNQDVAGHVAISITALVTGLTPATAYWIDIGAQVNAGVTATYTGAAVTVEIP